jgi:hypothetical protein
MRFYAAYDKEDRRSDSNERIRSRSVGCSSFVEGQTAEYEEMER